MANVPSIQLDSSDPQASWNRHPGPVRQILRCDSLDGPVRLLSATGETLQTWQSIFTALEWLGSSDARKLEWIGFLSYNLGRCFEALPVEAMDDLDLPLFIFTGHVGGDSQTVSSVDQEPRSNTSQARSTFSPDEYRAAVRRCIDYIAAGDVFQINLSQRFSVQSDLRPADIYSRLKQSAPALFGALLDYGDFALICNSPELFFRVSPDRTIITRPIKGTRARVPGMDEELRRSIKDQAELNMIVDLERNDLGRVCQIGSVRVTEPRSIEAHPTVYHGVATIEGVLRNDVTLLDLLRAVFPGGSITGAPKIRAMEIIESLEPTRRGPYCGAIGYLARDGTMQFNIAIRTMIATNGIIHIPVGGGIVADSDPQAEYEETLVKARAMFDALGISAPS